MSPQSYCPSPDTPEPLTGSEISTRQAATALPGVEAGLRAALLEAIEELEDMLPYVPEYFAQKWGYRESIDKLKAVLENS